MMMDKLRRELETMAEPIRARMDEIYNEEEIDPGHGEDCLGKFTKPFVKVSDSIIDQMISSGGELGFNSAQEGVYEEKYGYENPEDDDEPDFKPHFAWIEIREFQKRCRNYARLEENEYDRQMALAK